MNANGAPNVGSVLDQILTWSQTRPLWQQDALRRLILAQPIDAETVKKYAEAALGGSPIGLLPIGGNHLRATGTRPGRTAVIGIRNVENVNSLATGEHLTFAPTGITIVYGDNASGKSGYARILKAVTRTRAVERVRNDVFREATLVPSATIDYAIEDARGSYEWRQGGGGPQELSMLSFFDRACSAIYLSRDRDVAYRPFGLDLFDGLVTVCEAVRADLDDRATEVSRRVPGLPNLADGTSGSRFLQRLSRETTDQEINEATSFQATDGDRLTALAEATQALKLGTAAAESDRQERLADRLQRVKQQLEKVGALASATTIERLVRLGTDAKTKREAAATARNHAMIEATLPGVGEGPWRNLWEAGRRYSVQVAYRGASYPVVENALCVLCQQSLDLAASARMTAFERFVQDETQHAADTAERDYNTVVAQLKIPTVRDQATTDLIKDLSPDHPSVAKAVDSYLDSTEKWLLAALEAISEKSTKFPSTAPQPPLQEVGRLLARLTQSATELRKVQAPGERAQMDAELTELQARKALSEARPVVEAERLRLRRSAAIATARSASSTHSITQQAAEITESALTEVLKDRFSRETDRLGLERVVLRTVGGRRGILMYRTGFVGALQDAPLPEVLSEGEQTALGMAGFLAEVWTDDSNSGVIFDDPVNSLDHERRDKVAERLIGLAAERQTIVFTHDVAFLLALKKHAVVKSVAVTERSVEKLHNAPGHCEDHHKFSAKLVKERLAELETGLQAIRARKDSMTSEQYRDETARWSRLLRKTWERAIEETLVGEILTRDDLQVHPLMVRTLVLFSGEDNRQLQHGYARATERSEAHDESAVINAPSPSLDDLASDLTALREWHKRLAGRKNYSDEKIYQLSDPRQPDGSTN